MTPALRRLVAQLHFHQLWLASLFSSRVRGPDPVDGRDAVRARFESHPAWPSSGVLGERR